MTSGVYSPALRRNLPRSRPGLDQERCRDEDQRVEFMLRHGADPNASIDDGFTCLLTAIESDHLASIQIVAKRIDAGADLHCLGIHGWAPLHMAAARGHVEKARLLLDAGAEVDQRKEIDAGETPLMEAAYFGRA